MSDELLDIAASRCQSLLMPTTPKTLAGPTIRATVLGVPVTYTDTSTPESRRAAAEFDRGHADGSMRRRQKSYAPDYSAGYTAGHAIQY